MSFTVSFNNTTYTLPSVKDRLYAANINTFLTSLANNALAKSGGNFTLTADVNWGASYGLISTYIKSRSSNISTTGVLRLANNEGIGWRNVANGADKILKLDAGDRLEIDGVDIVTVSSTDTLTNKSISGATNTLSAIPTSALASTSGSGNVALTTGATLVTPVIDDYLELNEESAPSTPSSGKVRVYAKTDKKIYTKDSAGTESQVGASGSGELNLIENPSDSNNWSETGTVFSTPATTTTAGDLPLGGLTDTAIQLVASGNGAEASHYNSYSFTTPASLSGKMKVEFYQRPGTGFAESEWTVSVYQSTTRQSLSTDSSGVSYLVNAANKRTVYVDLLASTAYTLRFARVAGSGSATLNISNVIVGPGIQPQGAVVSAPKTVTPSVSNFGTISSTRGEYVRVGNIMRLSGKFASGTPAGSTASITIPDSLNIDTVYWESGQLQARGKWTSTGASGVSTYSSNRAGQFTLVSGTTSLAFSADNSDLNFWGASNANAIVAGSGDIVSFEVDIPIAEWAGSGTVTLAQNDVEYAYNTSTSTSSDTTSFGYGPQGALIQNFAPSGTTGVAKRIRFQTPIQATDSLVLEIQEASSGLWAPLVSRLGAFSSNAAGTVFYGNQIIVQNTTEVDVYFYSLLPSQLAWSVINTYRWRVRKSSAGAAVGFGIVSETSSGLMPSTNVNLDNASATRLGLKQYLHGTTYNGGNAPTVTLTAGGGSLSSVNRATFVPYQMQGGEWRMRINIHAVLSSTTRTTHSLAINGVSFKTGPVQVIAALTNQTAFVNAYCTGSSIVSNYASAIVDASYLSGDIELESKPTWAY